MDESCGTSSAECLPSLPAVISDERDRTFLTQINDWISSELGQVNARDTHQYFTIYKQVFNKVSNSCHCCLHPSIIIIIIIIRSRRQQRSVASTQSGHDDEPWTIQHEC